MSFNWTPEQFERAKRLALSGSTSREVAEIFNADYGCSITRNSVIGKLHRGGVLFKQITQPVRRLQGKMAADNARRVRGVVMATKPPPVPPRPFAARVVKGVAKPDPLNLTLLELGMNQCRWVTTDDYKFCGAAKHPGSSYCPYHHRLSTSGRKALDNVR